jgi:hypothetical protein
LGQSRLHDRRWASSWRSLVASLSSIAELLEGCIDITTANRVRWGTRLALAATLSHFAELEVELELLGFGHPSIEQT